MELGDRPAATGTESKIRASYHGPMLPSFQLAAYATLIPDLDTATDMSD